MTTKSLNKQFVARVLDRTALTCGQHELASACEELVAAIDRGASSIPAKTEALVNAAWASTARGVAAAEKPADLKRAITALKSVAALEQTLGLAPQPATKAEPVDEPVTEPAADTGYGYTSDDGFGGAA